MPDATLVTFDVVAADAGAEIFLIDGNFKLVKRGIGRETFSVPAGIYKIKNRSGGATVERMIVVRDGMKTVELEPVLLSSAMPLRHSTKTLAHHIDAARRAGEVADLTHGSGGAIVIVVSKWTPPSESAPAAPLPNESNPARGLKLLDLYGELVVDVERSAKVHGEQDPSATLHVALDPGAYRLALVYEDGSRIDQTLIVSAGWQTQIYLLVDENAGRGFGYADLINGAITIRKPQEKFEPDDARLRAEEIARGALQGARKILSDELRAQIVRPDASPMLALFGAHLLIREARRESEQKANALADDSKAEARLEALRRIVDNLRSSIGIHPDVEAIATFAGNADPNYVFRAPPMLRPAWPLFLSASVQRPSSVPADSLPAVIAERIWGEGPWLMWLAADANDKIDRAALWHRKALELLIAFGTRNRAKTVGIDAKAIDASLSLTGRAAAAFLPRAQAFLRRRTRTPFPRLEELLTHAVEQKVEDDLKLYASKLTNEQREDLVMRLGVPLSRVDSWLDQIAT
jgi:hypothetical protein